MATGTATARPEEAAPLLQMRGITKRFPGVLANDDVDFDVRRRRGARPVRRERRRQEHAHADPLRPLPARRGRDPDQRGARRHLVARRGHPQRHRHDPPALHARQHAHRRRERRARPEVVPRPAHRPRQSRRRGSTELAERYGLEVDPDALVWQLSVGERQRVEIIKALYRDVSLLVLDEPTAVLTPQEVDDLFARPAAAGAERARARLHLPQGQRGARALRPDHRAAGRQAGRHAVAPARRRRTAARRDDGRATSCPPTSVPAGSRCRRAAPRRPRPRASQATAARGGPRRRSRGATPARSSASPASPATASASSPRPSPASAPPRPARSASSAPRWRAHRRPAARGAGLAYVPEERMRDGIVPDFSVAENLLLVDNTSPAVLALRLPARHARSAGTAKSWSTPST